MKAKDGKDLVQALRIKENIVKMVTQKDVEQFTPTKTEIHWNFDLNEQED